ncbi:MAG: hypothetical protein KME15_00205 [Drouetiella hepatica Uher 2000/2452]|uniref:Uncharacterized protein n=1 Tax=Drouetiella hepatica Uher 2000/2452 TaxID=904376 RepID=A0A951Q5M1_9CYAN|nr:hypothetical protein [Drouetiella hepatica Uher 2000/2452]
MRQQLAVTLGDRPSDNAVEQEEEMVVQDKSASDEASQPKVGKLELADKPAEKVTEKPEANGRSESGMALHVDAPGELEASGLSHMPSDDLEVYGLYFNNRPISASHLHIASYALPGHRPIFASELAIREDLSLPGGRPVMVSDPRLMETSGLPGGRPIASNDINESEPLMGFLD